MQTLLIITGPFPTSIPFQRLSNASTCQGLQLTSGAHQTTAVSSQLTGVVTNSTETALLRMLNNVYWDADNQYRTILLQLDLSSALDTSTRLRRIRFTYGLSGPALNWVRSYLVCRSQLVRVGQKQSSSIVCEYGVPQGSVLGVNHAQFVDDMPLYITFKDDNSTSRLSDYFHAVQHWLDLNGSSMNPDKTEANVNDKRTTGLL